MAPRPRRARGPAPDAGFTLTEVVVSMMLVGVVMGALTTFYVNTMSIMSYQRGKQTAVQLASSGMEEVRALKAPDLASPQPVTTGCPPSVPVTGVDLTGQRLWKQDCPSLGLPYSRYWFVGDCWQPAGGGPCAPAPDAVKLVRVVVAVAWRDRPCPGSACTYATSTLVSADTDPTFDPAAKAPEPVVSSTARTGEVSVPVNVRIDASGAAPLTFFATGLPDGLSMDSSGLVTGVPTTAGGYPVTVSVTDGFGDTGSASVTWTIVPTPQLANPGPQATGKGLAVNLTVPVVRGTGTWTSAKPGTWSATGLPPGLSIDARTGVISGTPAAIRPPRPVTVTVIDANDRSGSVTFPWTVGPAITSPAARTDRIGTCVDLRATATSDGTAPYRWSAVNLPDGLTMTQDGRITGCIAYGTRYLPTVTVTDATGASTSLTFTWTVDPTWWDPWGLWRLQVSDPTGDRVDGVDQPVTVPLETSWGWLGLTPTWTADGLPPGVVLQNRTLTGAPTQTGTYVVTLRVRQSRLVYSDTATFMFTWTVR